jgi:hypothetical protein
MANVLSFELNNKAEWRDQKAAKHPEDARNAKAAQLLRELADQEADNHLTELFEMLSEGEAIDLEKFNEAVSEELTDIGFQSQPQSVDEVLKSIIQRFAPRGVFDGIGLN